MLPLLDRRCLCQRIRLQPQRFARDYLPCLYVSYSPRYVVLYLVLVSLLCVYSPLDSFIERRKLSRIRVTPRRVRSEISIVSVIMEFPLNYPWLYFPGRCKGHHAFGL